MFWILLALSAYFLLAIVEIVDKRILSNSVLSPLVCAFYTGCFTFFAFFLWFFDFSFLSPIATFIAILSGASFFAAVFFLYDSIMRGEVSRVISIIGGFSPILIFIFSSVFLKENFRNHSLIAMSILVVGSITLSFIRSRNEFKFEKNFFVSSFLAAFFIAFSFFLTKIVFLKTPFLNGFTWIRIGTLFCIIPILIFPRLRNKIVQGSRGFSSKLTSIFIINKIVSGLAYLVLNYAIMIGSVAVINALQGVEYAFIFLFTLGLSHFFPKILYEHFSPKILTLKIIGISLICIGVVALFLGHRIRENYLHKISGKSLLSPIHRNYHF